MTDRIVRNLLWLPLLFLLTCCSIAVAKTKTAETSVPSEAPVFRIVYCAGSTGHFKPCPT